MTENEAKTKWCPFARHNTSGKAAGSENRLHHDRRWEKEPVNCIGSACMAWRETTTDIARPTGFCGLAGKP